jgi:hypothetical protein
MSVFKDSVGQEWRVFLDAFSLADVATETGVDLADISAGGWARIETDAGLAVRVLAVLCRDEIAVRKLDARAFARLVRGAAIDAARTALVTEGAEFFPTKEWSALLSNLAKRKTARDQAETMATAMAALDGMSPEFRAGAMQALLEMATTAATAGINSSSSPDSESVVGPDVTPSFVVTSGPVKSESVPGD